MVLTMVVLWVTVGTGVIVFALWSPSGDRRKPRLFLPVAVGHIAMAVGAVGAWTVYAIGRSRSIGVASLGLLAVAVVAGLATVVITRRWERRTSASGDVRVPPLAFVIHGLVAVVGVFGATWTLAHT